jgi:hypothetical protein
MIWRIAQAAIVVGVAGWLLASGATTNGLAAGVVGAMAARVFTAGAIGFLGWRERRSTQPGHQNSWWTYLTARANRPRSLR